MGIGPMTSSLPKKCSTTELRGHRCAPPKNKVKRFCETIKNFVFRQSHTIIRFVPAYVKGFLSKSRETASNFAVRDKRAQLPYQGGT
jgi:hypothetical protein